MATTMKNLGWALRNLVSDHRLLTTLVGLSVPLALVLGLLHSYLSAFSG